MSISISSVEHAFAAAAQDTVKAARFVQAHVLPALQKVQANEQTIEAITGTISPQAANIERIGFAVLGVVIKAVTDAGAAGSAGGLNVSLDAQLVTDIKAIVPAVMQQAALSVAAAPKAA